MCAGAAQGGAPSAVRVSALLRGPRHLQGGGGTGRTAGLGNMLAKCFRHPCRPCSGSLTWHLTTFASACVALCAAKLAAGVVSRHAVSPGRCGTTTASTGTCWRTCACAARALAATRCTWPAWQTPRATAARRTAWTTSPPTWRWGKTAGQLGTAGASGQGRGLGWRAGDCAQLPAGLLWRGGRQPWRAESRAYGVRPRDLQPAIWLPLSNTTRPPRYADHAPLLARGRRQRRPLHPRLGSQAPRFEGVGQGGRGGARGGARPAHQHAGGPQPQPRRRGRGAAQSGRASQGTAAGGSEATPPPRAESCGDAPQHAHASGATAPSTSAAARARGCDVM